MAKDKVVVHALKTTRRAGRVNFVSVAFDGPSVALAITFRDRLAALLRADEETFGRFEVHSVPGRPDWFIAFADTCGESELDARLKAVAGELKAMIYIEPGIPVQEMGTGDDAFLFRIDPDVDRTSN